MKRAIKTHAVDFAAIVVLLILSVGVAAYILNHERLRFPFIQSSPFAINAEFSTAQAVTPGQGQSVRVSGVQIGTVGNVTLNDGMATVQMNIDPKYKGLIHQNWTALLRPKTGLKDMFIELAPGPGSSPVAKPGYTIPITNTNPDVNVDEILSSLDGDTRAYLQLLINGAGQGLSGKGGSELAQVFERFEPTHRDLARVNQAIGARGADLRQLINSLQRLNSALAQKQTQLVELVQSSGKVFRAFASEDGNISQAVKDLPGTLSQTTATLQRVTTFARLLGPTSTNLLPAARAIPSANAALVALAQPSTPIVRNQIRPFVIAARPTVRQLRPAAINLSAATPNLSNTFTVINHLANMLGYNPGNSQHGYLWWLAWLDHEVRTLFSIQDANGVFRPLFLQMSCSSMAQLSQGISGSALLLNLTPILTDASLCPGGGATSGVPGLPSVPIPLSGRSSGARSGATGTGLLTSPAGSGLPTTSTPGSSSSSTTTSSSAASSSSPSSSSSTASSSSSTSSSQTQTSPLQTITSLLP